MSETKTVQNFTELIVALDNRAKVITVERSMLCNHSFILPAGTTLKGKQQENGELPLLSFDQGEGIGVTASNTVADLNIQAPADKRAIFCAATGDNLGHFQFTNLQITGQFSFIVRRGFKQAQLTLDTVEIVASDSRRYLEQPQKYGVNALQGALTIYNFSSDEDSRIVVSAKNIAVGRKNAPVVGSGIFIAGFGDKGGKTILEKLHTKTVYSNGKIPFGVADIITAGVFILNGTHAKEIIHDGEVVTYGVNDMVLDTWGEVDTWTANAPVISYGPSGVGFVNFGVVKKFSVNAPLATYGLGARGYNQYDGTVDDITFESISTYGDGSVAIQISKKIGTITVNGDVSTYGSIGNSLVKGVNVELPAIALSVKEGGEVNEITINGNVQTFGPGVISYSVDGGLVHKINVTGDIVAHGTGSEPLSISNGGQTPTDELRIK
jgi:hypothetical protein